MHRSTKGGSVFISDSKTTLRAVPAGHRATQASGASSSGQRMVASCARLRGAVIVALLAAGSLATGCVTVRPEQRAILADPVMQFQGDPREAAQRQHVLDNREGSFGGTSVQGGGCGCN